MKFREKALAGALAKALSAGAVLSILAVTAHAQQATRVDKIEVTGSNIKRVDTEAPAVVQIIKREDIERSGASNVAELLRELPAIAGGSAQDFGSGTGFQPGNQTASLRGLGSVSTLVLLNGRRLPPAPYADPNLGQGSSYNLNSIPISAIERIEVLKDGGSAIYGSDAMAGVINIILRKDYKGAEVTGNHWQTWEGRRYEQNQVSGAIGFGDIAQNRWNVLIAGEWMRRDAQPIKDSGTGVENELYRQFANRNVAASALSVPANRRRESVLGSGNFNTRLPVDPNCPTALRVPSPTAGIEECRFDNFDYLEIQSKSERKALMGRATFAVSSAMTAFIEASINETEAKFISVPPSLDGAAISTWFAASGQRFRYQLILPPGHPDNPNAFPIALRYRFLDAGFSQQFVDTTSIRAVAGLQGTWRNWDWETGVMFAETEREELGNGSLHFPSLLAAVNNGTYRFNGSVNSPAVLAAIHPYRPGGGTSTIKQFDIKGSRELWELRGGPMAVAAGLEFRKEELSIFSDPRQVAGEILGRASSTVSGSRDVTSFFTELSAPVFKNVETQLAFRYDKYSDYGSSFTPKVGVKWVVMPALAARATYAQGFRAPSLFQISNSNVQSFNAGINDPVRCGRPGAEPEDCSRTISSLIQANTNLQPEESTSSSVGFIFSPTPNFQASIDHWYIHRTDFIDRFDSQTVINNEFNPLFTGGSVLRDQNPGTFIPGVPNSGPILSTIRRFDNFGGTATRGTDLDVEGVVPMGSWGKLNLRFNATYTDFIKWQLGKGNVPYINGAGNFYIFEAPRKRGNTSAVWDTGSFSFLARLNYVGSWFYGDPTVTGGGDGGQCYLGPASLTLAQALGGDCKVRAWRTWDLGVTYKGIKNLTLSGLLRNVGDKAAPFDPNQTTLGFNPTFANPYGRYLQVGMTYKFR